MTTYAFLIYGDDSYYAGLDADGQAALMDAHGAFAKAVADLGGSILGGEELAGSGTATTVRGGTVTDGPFAETKESLGGFYLVQARDLDHALDLARLCPAPGGCVEVRPVVDHSGA